ncbi:MAG: hypothetical protein ACKPKO_43375, partial [Candidatus Fonsibacter sp.]
MPSSSKDSCANEQKPIPPPPSWTQEEELDTIKWVKQQVTTIEANTAQMCIAVNMEEENKANKAAKRHRQKETQHALAKVDDMDTKSPDSKMQDDVALSSSTTPSPQPCTLVLEGAEGNPVSGGTGVAKGTPEPASRVAGGTGSAKGNPVSGGTGAADGEVAASEYSTTVGAVDI